MSVQETPRGPDSTPRTPMGASAGTHSSGPAPCRNRGGFAPGPGLVVERRFTEPGDHPFDRIEWDRRTAGISTEKGEAVFEQENVEVPRAWSQTATNIVAQKYFRGTLGTPQREHSVRQLIGRVVGAIAHWGDEGGYFRSEVDRDAFRDELTHLLVHQMMSFNSPVWFNCGDRGAPAGLGLLHQQRAGLDDLDPRARQDRGDAVQVRVGYREQPVGDPLLARGPVGRRNRVRPGLVHEGLRRVRRRDQVGRQDAARGEDGDPERGPPRHRRLHRQQGA